jgi:hypothetical protein
MYRYFDVEEKYVALEEGRYVITPELARDLVDENTIGVVGILGESASRQPGQEQPCRCWVNWSEAAGCSLFEPK